jgi:hypothetical protein
MARTGASSAPGTSPALARQGGPQRDAGRTTRRADRGPRTARPAPRSHSICNPTRPPVRRSPRNLASTRCASCASPARWTPEGARDWRLSARLGATVVQPCVATLAPVTTRIDTDVTRRYLADWQEPEGDEAEMPRGRHDRGAARPHRPVRRDGRGAGARPARLSACSDAEIGTAQFAAPGVAPMTDDDAKPLAGPGRLRDRMREDDESDNGAGADGRRAPGRSPAPSAREDAGKRTCMGTESEYVPGLARPW